MASSEWDVICAAWDVVNAVPDDELDCTGSLAPAVRKLRQVLRDLPAEEDMDPATAFSPSQKAALREAAVSMMSDGSTEWSEALDRFSTALQRNQEMD